MSFLKLLSVLIILPSLGLQGCAGVSYGIASSEESNGIRYYRPATYALIMPDYEANTASVSFFEAPDTRQAYLIKPYAFMAQNNTSIAFKDGLLSSTSTKSNSTKVIKSAVEATAELAKKGLDLAAKQGQLASMFAAALKAKIRKAPVKANLYLLMLSETGWKQVYPPPFAAAKAATEPEVMGTELQDDEEKDHESSR